MMQVGILFLQKSFQLQPLIRKGSSNYSFSSIFVTILVGAAVVLLIFLLNNLRKKIQGSRDTPRFTKDNFYKFASKSGLSRNSSDYLYKKVQSHRESNPMRIFFNYSYMIRIFKSIYQQEKTNRANDILQFQENIFLLIDSIDMLEKHFHSVSAVLSTRLIPNRATVFLSDLKNNFRIKMLVKRNTAKSLILGYKFTEDNNDTRLHKVGRQLTLWLLNDSRGGYAAYNVRLKRIKKYDSENKEYYITHNWRQEIPNITRKHKRIPFTQQAQLRTIGSKNAQSGSSTTTTAKAMMLDISLGGCSMAINQRYEKTFTKTQRVIIKFPNPYFRSKQQNKEDSYYELKCSITHVTVFSDQSNDGLINVHLRFDPLKRNIKNSLGLFIYEFEDLGMRATSSAKSLSFLGQG